MAKRYSGTVTISIRYVDNESAYRCYLTSPTTMYRRGVAVAVRRPAVSSISVDSPRAYDEVAHAALSFVADGFSGQIINAERIVECAEANESGWYVSRSSVRACCDRDDRRQAAKNNA